MHVMHLIDMCNVAFSSFSYHLVFYKAIWRGCESIWFKVYTSNTCWQPRWLNSQWKCQPGLSGFYICGSICTWKCEREVFLWTKNPVTSKIYWKPTNTCQPSQIFCWGFLGKRCFSQHGKSSDSCGIPNGNKWNRADGCDDERGSFCTTSNTTAELRAIQKTSFSHDLQTTRAPAYESMTEQCF